jgi:anaerobic selenocysteine-containing dehydrogenase
VIEPDRDVRPFQSVLIDLSARLHLPGFINPDGSARYADYADYLVNHQRRPGVGPLSGWRLGPQGLQHGRGEPNGAQLDEYIRNGGFWQGHVPEEAAFYKPWNRAYQDWAVRIGLYDAPQPYILSLWSEPLRRFQLACEGEGPRQPPDHLRARLHATMDPLPVWYEPFGDDVEDAEYPLHALTQRPMAMYHAWHSQNAWLRQIHGRNPLYVPKDLWESQGFQDGDWARVTSPHGQITVPVARMDALNPNSVWTWNAIGKRKGAWALSEDAPEATRGFLLNHLISELLPPKGDGHRWSNSDPITGQAAWFDLRVRVEKCDAPAECAPALPPLGCPVEPGPASLAWKVRP